IQDVSYTVTATDLNGCVNYSVLMINVNECTGLSDSPGSGMLKIYPNPNAGSFYIENDTPCQARLLNAIGQEIMVIQLQAGKNEVLMNEQAKGIYFIEIWENNNTRTERIIRQ